MFFFGSLFQLYIMQNLQKIESIQASIDLKTHHCSFDLKGGGLRM